MTIMVVGPPRAGVDSVVMALREAMPGRVLAGAGELELDRPPVAVVFVVSATATATASDCDLIEQACGCADLVIGAVSKIDAHRPWRDVMDADRILLAERDARYSKVPWVGVAAAPELGDRNVDELVALLADGLDDPDLIRRNQLRVNAVRARINRDDLAAIARDRRSAAATVRAGVQQARVRLTFLVRRRCAQVLADLRLAAGEVSRGGSVAFEAHVRAAAEEFVVEVAAECARELNAVAASVALVAPDVTGLASPPTMGDPRLRTDRLQLRLTAVLGVGFGAGVALASSRLLTGAIPGADVIGYLVGGLFGMLAAAWVIGARGLLHDRATLDGWAGEVAATLRACGEEMVTTLALAAETTFMTDLAARDESLARTLRF